MSKDEGCNGEVRDDEECNDKGEGRQLANPLSSTLGFNCLRGFLLFLSFFALIGVFPGDAKKSSFVPTFSSVLSFLSFFLLYSSSGGGEKNAAEGDPIPMPRTSFFFFFCCPLFLAFRCDCIMAKEMDELNSP